MESLLAVRFAWLIPLLPLAGAAAAGFFGARWLKGRSHWPVWLTVGASAVISLAMLAQMAGRVHHYEYPQAAEQPAGQALQPRASGEILSAAMRNGVQQTWFTWISAGGLHVGAGAWLDPLTAVMLCVVTVVGLLITIYARGYMAGDRGYFRFFAYLGLFIFMMSMLVMGDSFLMLYLGWEGVGLCSYLLIGHYYQKPSARDAAMKAFVVNRIGDAGFALGIMLIYVVFGTVNYYAAPDGGPGALLQAFTTAPRDTFEYHARQWIPFLLMLGAFGKSAQFPLYVWLPDAMEGPTPVSALIHAATMVTAGVYMIVRCGPLFAGVPAAMWTVAIVGTFTAVLAAVIALRQFDLKRVFAYSTISQLGFMFAAAGALAPVAAVFHLVTHAFFKALLFLSSGVVMHAMHGHLDMRRMSGLKRVLPWTNILMLTGCLALAGFPLFSGFFSKDQILSWAFHRSAWLGIVLLLTALLTAYYTFRLYFRVFQGPLVQPPPEEGAAHDAHGHSDGGHAETPVMIAPLVVLALGALLAGYVNWPEWEGRKLSLGAFLGASPSLILSFEMANAVSGNVSPAAFGLEEIADPAIRNRMSVLHMSMAAAGVMAAFLGIYAAYLLHRKYRQRGEAFPQMFPRINRAVENRFWVDEVYQFAAVAPLRRLARVCVAIDRLVIDAIITAAGWLPQVCGLALKVACQRGSLQGYATLMIIAAALVLIIMLW